MNIIALRKRSALAVIAAGAMLLSLLGYAMPALAAPPSTPVITTVTQSTTTDPILLTGTGDANVSIQVTGGVSPVTASTTAGGDWSVSVDLTDDSLNTLQVVSFNVDGEFSATSTVDITHTSTTTATTTPDVTPPAPPIVVTFPSCATTSPVTIAGTAEADSTISITGGTSSASATTSAGGSWSSSVDISTSTANTLGITATDASGNTSGTTTIEIDTSTTSPSVELQGDAFMTVFNDNPFSDPGVTFAGGTLTTTGEVNLDEPGTYTITYTVAGCGGTVEVERTVQVLAASSGGGGGSDNDDDDDNGSASDDDDNNINVSGGNVNITTSGTPFIPVGGTTAVIPVTSGVPQVLGATFIPGIPSTGTGADLSESLALMTLSLALASIGLYLAKRKKLQS